MWESIHKNHLSPSIAQQLTQVHQRLLSMGERERILRERSADREAHRYLLDAHRLLAQESFPGDRTSNIFRPGMSDGGQLAA